MYLVICIIDSWEGAFVALGPGLNGKIGLGHSTSRHTLHSTLFGILQYHCDERARGNRGRQGEGEEGGRLWGEGETLFVGHIGRHVCIIHKDLWESYCTYFMCKPTM